MVKHIELCSGWMDELTEWMRRQGKRIGLILQRRYRSNRLPVIRYKSLMFKLISAPS